jgi:hypothetical protein
MQQPWSSVTRRDRRAWSRPEALNPENISPPANRKTEQPATVWFWLLGENFAKIWKTGQQPWSSVTLPALPLMRCRADGRVQESRFRMTPTING